MAPMNRVSTYVLVGLVTIFAGACGGNDDEVPTGGEQTTPAVEESAEAEPAEDTVPLEDAKTGDLIALPFYPGVGVYSGTADVRGLKTFEMEVPRIANVRTFAPSVLIGSPGQEIRLTGFEQDARTMGQHDFRIGDTPDFSIDHEIVGEIWDADKSTEFTLTFPQEGSVSFYCSYHLRINMAGMLIVKE